MATQEAEEVLFGSPRVLRVEKGRVKGEDVYEAFGQTGDGRYLVVFFINKAGAALPISARDMTDSERRYYGKGKRPSDKLPEEFSSYEEAGEFWDTHDSTEYLDQMTPVEVDARLEVRHFEIEVDEDVIALLRQRALSQHLPASKLANDLLRKELAAR